MALACPMPGLVGTLLGQEAKPIPINLP